MATFSKVLLSGSTEGKAIKVAGLQQTTITTTTSAGGGSSFTYTYNTSVPHGLSTGNVVTVTGNSVANYNVTSVSITVTTTTAFTVATGSPAGSSGTGGTVTVSASPPTTVHATGTSSTIQDEVWLYAYNSSASATVLTIQWGGVTSVDNEIKLTIPAVSGLTLVVPGLIITGDGAIANTVAAYAGTANVITVSGYVNRIA
jgi:hypothetical protein